MRSPSHRCARCLDPELRSVCLGIEPSWRDRVDARTPDGRLWFANNDVLQTLDPATVIHGGSTAEVYIESLIADQRPFPLHDGLVIPALTLDVQIDYTTPNSWRERVRLKRRS
jgi:hypothetical protein